MACPIRRCPGIRRLLFRGRSRWIGHEYRLLLLRRDLFSERPAESIRILYVFRSVEVDYSRFREQNEVRFSYGIGPVDGFEDVWYRYRVNGAGGNWSDPSLGTRSILQNLPAFGVDSTFYLEVQASFDRDVWSQALVRYPVTIAPAFWFTWWGLSISAGLLSPSWGWS